MDQLLDAGAVTTDQLYEAIKEQEAATVAFQEERMSLSANTI